MSVVKQKDKRSGITYVYESVSWYDKETRNARSKRRLIGRWDEEKGIVVPTDGRCRKDKAVKPKQRDNEKPQNVITEGEYELLYKQAVEKIRCLEERIKELESELKG